MADDQKKINNHNTTMANNKNLREDGKKGNFAANPQNINRNGRPRKSWNVFNAKYKELGVDPLTKKDYFEAVTYLMSLTAAEMEEEYKDKENPQWLIWIIGLLRDSSSREKVMTDHRNWVFGKAEETINHTGEIKTDLNINIDGVDLGDKIE